MAKRKDLTGQKFGMLTVLGFAPDGKRADGSNLVRFYCVCDCGKEVVVTGKYLTSGDIKSCGGHRTYKHTTKHGMCGTRLYHIWNGIKQRCLNQNNKNYQIYGGRGIKICDDWLEFIPFYEWAINNGYTDKLSIDRINVDGDYEPFNCRWATAEEQANNQRNNVVVSYDGDEYTVAQLMRKLNMSRSQIMKMYNN